MPGPVWEVAVADRMARQSVKAKQVQDFFYYYWSHNKTY